MYRAIALFAVRENLMENGEPNKEALRARLPELEVDFHVNPDTRQSEVFLNGVAVEQDIRNMDIAELASKVSKFRMVRDKLQVLQKIIAARKGVIMDGRDIGTVVIPDAELKIFMTADPEVRAQRRFLELKAKNQPITLEEVRQRQSNRDYEDVHRAEDPLKKADDAIVLDNSHMDQEAQLAFVMAEVQRLTLKLQD
jgi:cytidylate kinase